MTDQHFTEETIFTWGAPPLKFGAGALDEVGFEMSAYGVRRVLIVTDAGKRQIESRRDDVCERGIEILGLRPLDIADEA